jgi:hypothetical protein
MRGKRFSRRLAQTFKVCADRRRRAKDFLIRGGYMEDNEEVQFLEKIIRYGSGTLTKPVANRKVNGPAICRGLFDQLAISAAAILGLLKAGEFHEVDG